MQSISQAILIHTNFQNLDEYDRVLRAYVFFLFYAMHKTIEIKDNDYCTREQTIIYTPKFRNRRSRRYLSLLVFSS